jgi:hypothetical protein
MPTLTQTPLPAAFPRPPEVMWPAAAAHPYPTSAVPRHGVAVALGGAPDEAYGFGPYSWTYSWTAYVPPTPKRAEHVPMLVGNPRSGLPPFEQIVERDGWSTHNYWLVFNECEHQGQCNTSPQEAARFFHDEVVELLFVQGADADADLIVGGVNAHPCGIQWLVGFVTFYEDNYGPMPRAGWHFHLYPEIQAGGWPNNCNGDWGFNDWLFPDVESAFGLWREHANNALEFVQQYGRPEDEVWFTEMGCLNYGYHQEQRPVCQADGFMQAYSARILEWLNGDGRWVTRYAWYTNWDTKYWQVTRLIAEAEVGMPWQYSSLGWWYKEIVPAAAVRLPGR